MGLGGSASFITLSSGFCRSLPKLRTRDAIMARLSHEYWWRGQQKNMEMKGMKKEREREGKGRA